MPSLLDRYNRFVGGEELKARLVIAVIDAAQAIANEDSGTANHTARLAVANLALNGLVSAKAVSEKIFFDLVLNPTINSEGDASTDSDIEFVVASVLSIPANLARYSA